MDQRQIKRGDIYYAKLRRRNGSIQGGIRPVLIVQSNGLNRYSPTVGVAAITSRLKKASASYHHVLPKIKGLPKQSMVLAEQRFTLNKDELIEYRCTLDEHLMRQVTKALNAAEAADGVIRLHSRRHRAKNRKGKRNE